MKRLKVLALVAVLGVVLAGAAFAICPENPNIWCGMDCEDSWCIEASLPDACIHVDYGGQHYGCIAWYNHCSCQFPGS